MQKLHQKLIQKYQTYNTWHQTKHHNKIHWGVFFIYSFVVFSFILNPLSFTFDSNNSNSSLKVFPSTSQAQTTLEIPLSIEEPAGIPRTNEPITSGIPLPPGTIVNTQEWSLWDGTTELPVQVTKLPGRTPWILLDFQVSLNANQKKTLTLKQIPSTASSNNPLTISEDTNQITISNNIIKTIISKTTFNLLEEVWLDKNNNQSFDQGEQIITPQPDNIQIIDSTTGQTFSGKGIPDKILWEYQGPMRSTLRVDGRFKNTSSQEFINYTTKITFYAGKSEVKIEHTLRNSYQPNERHVKIKSAIVKIGSGTTSVRATRPGSTSWANVDTGGDSFELVPLMLWDIDTATNNGMVLPDWSYHGATIITDFAENLTSTEQTNRTNASKAPLFAIAPGSWYSEYGELSTSKFSTLQDEKDAYTKWGWSWTSGQEPQDQLATGPGKTIPDYAVSWRDVSVHGDTESDDLWQHNLMYLRTGQRSYWDRAVAWARYQKWEYAFRTDGFNYAWDGPFEQAAARLSRPAISIPLTTADQSYLNGIYGATNGGRVDVLDWGADHFWGWGLIDYYYLTGDKDALEAVGDLAEVSQRVLGWRQPGSYLVGNFGFRQEARHLLLLIRLYEATQDPKWKILMDTIAQLFLQSPDWDNRGFYPTSVSGTSKTLSTLHLGFLDQAFERYYQITSDPQVRDRLIKIAYFVKTYGLPLAPEPEYTGNIVFDDPNPGDWYHVARNDPAYTITLIDSLVRGYHLTNDISLLEQAKYYWHRGSKAVIGIPPPRTAADNEVGRFMNNGFLYSGIRLYYTINRGDLSYAHLLFYDYAHLGSSPDTTAPTAPTNLIVTPVSSSQINLSWTASTDNVGVTGYRVYRNETQIATSTNTSYSDTGLVPSTTYSYAVAAFDAAGNVSAQSSTISVTTPASPDTTPPTIPTNLTATAISSSQIDLSWVASTDNVAVTGYLVYRNGIQITTTATTSYSNTGLLPSISYSYSVAAIDAAGNTSAKSAGVSATTLAASSNPIDNLEPGHWYEVSDSHLRDVAPCGGNVSSICGSKPNDPPQEVYNSYAIYNFSHIIGGWNGGAFDTKRDRLLIWGGGHHGWAGNDIYGFDLNTLKWERIKDADWLSSADTSGDQTLESSGYFLGAGGTTPDPKKPRTRHTYNYIQYVPAIDRFCSFGGTGFTASGQTGTPRVDCFNFSTLEWEQNADTPSSGTAFSAVDPVTGHIWVRGAGLRSNSGLAEYDPIKNIWTRRGDAPTFPYSKTAAIDPKRSMLVAPGSGAVWAWDIGQSGTLTMKTLSTVGGDAIINGSPYPGFVYDSFSEKLVAWNGGADVYTLDMDTLVWTKHTPAPTNTVTPTAAGGNGTYGRFRYSPNKNAFVVVNSVDQNVYIYKLNPGGGTPGDTTPPATPTNLTVTPISSSQINLSWSASTDNVGVAGYKIYRCAGSGCAPTVQIATSAVNSYSDTGLTASTAYTYAVSAYDAAGNESGKSGAVSVATLSQFKQTDFNKDGVVNQLDFDILKQDWKRTDKPISDINQDGIVDSRDLGIMMSSWEN